VRAELQNSIFSHRSLIIVLIQTSPKHHQRLMNHHRIAGNIPIVEAAGQIEAQPDSSRSDFETQRLRIFGGSNE
jgi:hypothetical protein